MKLKEKIAVDMDGVLADTEKQYLLWYHDLYGVSVDPADLLGKPEGEGFPVKDAIKKFVHTPGFFRSLPVMPGAVDALGSLAEKYEIYIASAAMQFPLSLAEKHAWLGEHFPFISWNHIVFCGNKSIIRADYLIDDHCHNLDCFNGSTILFNASHNINVTHHQRANSWQEVSSLIQNSRRVTRRAPR